ncbi:hypothetical protein B0H13DRAFT_1862556 [Mycena leptocephala]|nr:hypothetical protein B0H13DRAFT_1862556 [Mycena leptocephala]
MNGELYPNSVSAMSTPLRQLLLRQLTMCELHLRYSRPMPTGMHPHGEEQARVVMLLPRDFSSSSCSSSMLVICSGLVITGVLEVKVPAQPAQKKRKTLRLLVLLLVVVLIPLRDAACANAEAESKCGEVRASTASCDEEKTIGSASESFSLGKSLALVVVLRTDPSALGGPMMKDEERPLERLTRKQKCRRRLAARASGKRNGIAMKDKQRDKDKRIRHEAGPEADAILESRTNSRRTGDNELDARSSFSKLETLALCIGETRITRQSQDRAARKPTATADADAGGDVDANTLAVARAKRGSIRTSESESSPAPPRPDKFKPNPIERLFEFEGTGVTFGEFRVQLRARNQLINVAGKLFEKGLWVERRRRRPRNETKQGKGSGGEARQGRVSWEGGKPNKAKGPKRRGSERKQTGDGASQTRFRQESNGTREKERVHKEQGAIVQNGGRRQNEGRNRPRKQDTTQLSRQFPASARNEEKAQRYKSRLKSTSNAQTKRARRTTQTSIDRLSTSRMRVLCIVQSRAANLRSARCRSTNSRE